MHGRKKGCTTENTFFTILVHFSCLFCLVQWKQALWWLFFLLKKPTTWVHGYSWTVQLVFQGLKTMSELFQVIIKTPWILVLHHCDVGDHMMGGKNELPQKSTFRSFPRAVHFWRAPSFWDKLWSHTKLLYLTDFPECLFWALKTHYLNFALSPPPHTLTFVYQLFFLARINK